MEKFKLHYKQYQEMPDKFIQETLHCSHYKEKNKYYLREGWVLMKDIQYYVLKLMVQEATYWNSHTI